MATTYLNNTFSSPTNNYKWTLSVWVKRSKLGANQYILQTYPSGEGYTRLYFDSTDKIQFDGEDASQGNAFNLKTTRLFRDTNAWYHIVLKWDVTQGTASNRIKIYINGVEEGNYGTETYPAQNTTYPINRDRTHYIGRHSTDTNTYFEGVMSHYHFTDGYAYDASTFGSTDSTTGEWKINASPSVTYGNNGFLILKDGNTITDQSSNSNNWTLAGGTLTKTEDCPSNVFATFNNLQYFGRAGPMENGNTKGYGDNVTSNAEGLYTHLATGTGKYYCEMKIQDVGSGGSYASECGISDVEYSVVENQDAQYRPFSYFYQNNGAQYSRGSGAGAPTTTSSWGSTYTTGDIIGIAVDTENNKLYFSKNGTWQNSADPSAGTNGISIEANKNYYFVFAGFGNSPGVEANFGNGYFSTTAVSSAGTNASNNGIFEYDVPTGFTALSTKGLNL